MRFTSSALLGFLFACSGTKALPATTMLSSPPSEAAAEQEPSSSSSAPLAMPVEKEAPVEPQAPACVKDRDCVVTTFAGCCACPAMPTAFFKPDLAKLEKTCDAVRCPPVVDMNCDDAVVDVSTYRARCVDSRCFAEAR